ncbi:MAG: hypothetical protein BM563_02170 [Bacteroidetes bacterium MedPE-SWsnd-G1]|nr:MAG: hypothetical protein BM563_02170 [Bacteroidetes bacterium MedPE-SWsnd-G1]
MPTPDVFYDRELEDIARHLVAICNYGKVETRAEAERYYREDIILNFSYTYTVKGKVKQRKTSQFGDLFPPKGQIYTISGFMKGNSSGGTLSMSSSMDCVPEAQTFIKTAKDPQQYGKAFFRAYCECENGVPDANRMKMLVADMKINHKNYHQFKSAAAPSINTRPLKTCPIVSISGNNLNANPNLLGYSNKFSVYNDPLVSSQVEGFVHDLAANSNNPDLKKMSKELAGFHQVQSDVNEYRNMFNITASQKDLQFDQVMTNAAQAVSIIKFLVNSFKKKKIELTPEQAQARSIMWEMRNNIKLIYDETRVLPEIKQFDQNALDLLDEYERKLLTHDLSTARERRLIIYYFWNPDFFTTSDLEVKMEQYSKMSNIDVIKQIDKWQTSAEFDHALYLGNSDKAFALNKYLIQLLRAKCYKDMGRPEVAENILNNLDFSITTGEAIKIASNSFQIGDFETVSMLFPLIKQFFIENPNPDFAGHFTIKQNATDDDLLLEQNQALLLLGSGVFAHIENKNFTAAKVDLSFIKNFIEKNKIEREGIVYGLEASLDMALENYETGLMKIDKAVKLENFKYDPGYNWVRFIKFKMLVELKRYDEAHMVYDEVNSNYMSSIKDVHKFFDIYEFKYAKCDLLFRQKDYETALYGLSLLETIQKKNKYNLLRSNILKAQGKNLEAQKELNKIK